MKRKAVVAIPLDDLAKVIGLPDGHEARSISYSAVDDTLLIVVDGPTAPLVFRPGEILHAMSLEQFITRAASGQTS